MEENFLGFLFAGNKLDIVDDQYIYHLVEIYKIIDRVVFDGLNDLVGKFFGRHVQHGFRIHLANNVVADGLCQVGFTEAHIAEDKQWVKGCATRFFGDSQTRIPRQAVAVTLNKIIKNIIRVELRINLDTFDTRSG